MAPTQARTPRSMPGGQAFLRRMTGPSRQKRWRRNFRSQGKKDCRLQELQTFIDFLEGVKKDELPRLAITSQSRVYSKEWVDALELGNMIHLLEAAARSALTRKESRGVHYREDFPHTDNDNWLSESIVKQTDDGLEITRRPVTLTTITPPKGVMPYLEMMKKMMQAHSDVGGHH